jgi:hypothetical protein
METRLTVIDRVPADDPRAFPSLPGICADAAALLDRVSRLVPPRPPATGVAMPPLPAFHLRSAPSARPKTPLPPLALVKRPAPIPDAVELAYETCAWTADGSVRFSGTLYEGYALQAIRIPDARPHPTKLVQSAAMAAVASPLLPAPFAAPPPVRRHPLGRAGRKRRLSQNRLPKSTARSMRSRRSDVGQFAQIPSS